MALAWSYGERVASLRLPFGLSRLIPLGTRVDAGDVVAAGTRYRATRRVDAAKVLGVSAELVHGLLRVRVGDAVREGAIVARSGRRFAKAIVAAQDGRLVHVDAAGNLYLGTPRGEWAVRTPLDGVVRRADADRVEIAGAAWTLVGVAAYGPARAGVLARAADGPTEDLAASRLDASWRGRIAFGAGRVGGEALSRAHAVGVAGLVCAAVSFRALEPVYGEDVSCFGSAHDDEEVPTLLVTRTFGQASFGRDVLARLGGLDGARAAIDPAGACLHVFADDGASQPLAWAEPRLEDDLSGERADRLEHAVDRPADRVPVRQGA
jgi:hypothetical protein